MYPTLFKIGFFEVHSYGFLLALSFLLGILLATYRAKSFGIPPGAIMDISVIVVVASIVGARFFYVVFHLDEFRGRWLDTINPIQPSGQIGIAGLTLFGGLLLAIACSFLYMGIKRLPLLRTADVIAPSVALGIFLTRIGCFLNGCCFGKPTDSFLGLVFPKSSAAGFTFPDLPLHPTQLYSSFYGLMIFLLLLGLEKKFRGFDGFTFLMLLLLYGLARFTVDFYRYYEPSMILIRIGGVSFSVNQGISALLVVTALALLITLSRRKTKKALDF